jgi:hypothetical protein
MSYQRNAPAGLQPMKDATVLPEQVAGLALEPVWTLSCTEDSCREDAPYPTVQPWPVSAELFSLTRAPGAQWLDS